MIAFDTKVLDSKPARTGLSVGFMLIALVLCVWMYWLAGTLTPLGQVGWLGLDSVEVILLVLVAIALLTSLRLARVALSALGGVVFLDAMSDASLAVLEPEVSDGLDQALALWFVELPFAAFCLWYAQRLHARLKT